MGYTPPTHVPPGRLASRAVRDHRADRRRGMGEVWRGKDTRLDRSVAIKILPAGFAEDAERRAALRARGEDDLVAQPPDICTLFDVGHEGDAHFLVMELLEGESLADRLRRARCRSTRCCKFGAQIADALVGAHRAGHRPPRPQARQRDADEERARSSSTSVSRAPAPGSAVPSGADRHCRREARPLTREGTILGTFQYMAPEQLEGAEADARTDIFALRRAALRDGDGAARLRGQVDQTSLIAAIVRSQPPPISSVAPMTPPALDRVVRKCLEKDPDDRWQSAHDVASELRWIERRRLAGGSRPRRCRCDAAVARAPRLGARRASAASTRSPRPSSSPTRARRPSRSGHDDAARRDTLIPFDELGLALSADGRQLAFVAKRATARK